MRKATFASLVFVVCGYATSAQLTLTPRAGIETSKTCINELGGASSVAPQVAARLDYQFKKMHGPFVGLATNRAQVGYSYTGEKVKTSDTKTQLRLEAGYMVNIKTTKNLRIQPFAGMAFANNPATSLVSNGNAYQFDGGSVNTAFISGANVVIGKGKLMVGAQYLQGLNSNTANVVVTDKEGVRTASVKSTLSAFNVTVGIPLSLTKAKKVAPAVKKEEPKKSCSYYRTRCGKWQ